MILALYLVSTAFAYLLIAGLVYEVKRVAWAKENAALAATFWPVTAVAAVAWLVFQVVAIDAPRAILRRSRLPKAEVRRGGYEPRRQR